MNLFLSNLFLALIWVFMTGVLSPTNLVVGFLVGYAFLLVARVPGRRADYFRKVGQAAGFLFFFAKEMLRSNLKVAWDVVTPTHHMKPGIVAIPMDARTDAEITFLANAISLTPGSLAVEVSEDRRTLYLHVLYVDDPEAIRREVKEGFERRILELMR